MLKEDFNVKTVKLYVTHGLFSFGYEHLKENIDSVFCYYSWLNPSVIEETQGYITFKEYFE